MARDTIFARQCCLVHNFFPDVRTKTNMIRLYRKVKVTDLIGGENGERKAKFIYDLARLVRYIAYMGSASLTCCTHWAGAVQPNEHSPPAPYSHPIFEALITRVAFLGNGIGRLHGLAEACSRKLGDDESFNPIPIPLLALAATAVGSHIWSTLDFV